MKKNNGSKLHSYVSFEVSHRLFNPTKINLNLFEIHNEIYLGDQAINKFEENNLNNLKNINLFIL